MKKQREKEEKKKKQEKESRKQKYKEDEEEQFIDDEERDPDFDPDKEEDVADDNTIEDENEEDTFQVEKHSHALNFSEAGEFVVWVRGKLNELERAVRWGKDMDVHYKTFVTVLKDAIIKMGSYAPIEGADIDAVIKTVVDTNCTAWKKAMKGVKTRNSKAILKIEEKREGVIRAVEDRDLPMDTEAAGVDIDAMEGKSEEEKKEIKCMLSKFWNHVSKAHEEASCAAGQLSRLAMVLEPDDHYKIVEAGTRPLIAMEIPRVQQLISEKKSSEERARSRDEKKNMQIEDIIIEQNLPTPLDRWKDLKVLLPTRYLAAAVHFFVYSQADQVHPLTNKFVAEKFKLSPSNLH